MPPATTRPSYPSISYYIVLCFLIGPVYAAIPFSWAFVLYSMLTGSLWSYCPTKKLAFLWASVEVVFSIYYYALSRRVMASPPPPPAGVEVLQAAFARVLKTEMVGVPEVDSSLHQSSSIPSPLESVEQLDFDDPRAKDFRNYMCTWFHKKPWSEIHSRELHQWLYWSSFNAHLPPDSELSAAHKIILDQCTKAIEKRAGATIKHGSNPTCKPMLPTLDPVVVQPRPLIFYALIWMANYYLRLSLNFEWGVIHDKCGNFEYLVRVPVGTKEEIGRPFVFLHGLGLGVLQYHQLIRMFFTVLPSRPILIPLQPHISQDIFHPRFLEPLSGRESVEGLTAAIHKLGWEDSGVDILSHSNGTFFHSWMLKAKPEFVKRSCFVDPVTFCSWEGDVCYNFIYQRCVTGVELLMRYYVGAELGVVNVLQRHFDWSKNLLWFEEIPNATDPRKAAFFMGGQDAIVDSERVRRYLRSHGVRKGLWFDPKGRHGQALIKGGEGMRQVVNWLLDDN
ncbi:hypothetical protein BU17DRAFT_37601 [Hysterangium stoloniferum]|nr:hypothetical protein BU17DRAFT_37601 [Hysterangium stoloniferum]